MTPYPTDYGRVSEVAGQVDSVFLFIVAIGLFFFFLTQGTLIWFAIRYRRRHSHAPVRTPDIKGHTLLEALWVAIPSLLVLAIFLYGCVVFRNIRTAPPGAPEILVTAKQWLYEFRYPDGRTEINTVRVPVGRPVRFVMTSPDVIHGFYLPAFRVKQDIVPGRYTDLWVQPEKAGRYDIYCTQYCGTGHSTMRAVMEVMPEADYVKWRKGKAEGGAAEPPWKKGEELMEKSGCLACHSIDGSPKIGPTLKGIFGRKVELADGREVVVDEDYVRESIVDPNAKVVKGFQPIMPTYKDSLKAGEITDIIAFVKTLR
jgi:cytochrome c oxidase subunit 2